MGAPPPQTPHVDFPGLEYFGNVGRGLALERRVAIAAHLAAPVSVPANGEGLQGVTLIVDPQFGPGKAIYFTRVRLNMAPSDQSGQLQVNGTQMEIQCPSGAPIVDIGFPLATLSTPVFQQTVSLEQDYVLTFQDAINLNRNISPTAAGPGALLIAMNVGVKNLDTVNPHSFDVFASVVGHIVSGLLFP